MSASRISNFGGHRLWRLDSDDLDAAARAISSGDVVGVSISYDFGFRLPDLHCLADLPKFNVLVTVYPRELDVSFIEQLPHLTYLSLGEGQSVPCDLNALPNLQTLRVFLSKRQTLPTIRMGMLRELAAWNLPEVSLEFLKTFPNLETLELIEARTLESTHGLRHCTNLTKLELAYCPKLHDLSALIQASSLERLELRKLRRATDLAAVYALERLRYLVLDKLPALPTLSPLPNLQQLEHFALMATDVLDADLSPVLRLPNLKHFGLQPEKKHFHPRPAQIKQAIKKRGG